MAPTVYTIASLLDALCDAVDAARVAAAGDSRWLNAIDSGYNWLLEQDSINFDRERQELTFTSESGETYHANGVCQCKAFAEHNACRHRAAARLVRRALETQPFTRIYAAFTAPNDSLYYALSAEEQGLYWECYNEMQAQSDAEYNARRDARSAEIAREQAVQRRALEQAPAWQCGCCGVMDMGLQSGMQPAWCFRCVHTILTTGETPTPATRVACAAAVAAELYA